jgi:signal transduction histidine kinase
MLRSVVAGFDTRPDTAPVFRLHFEQDRVQAAVDRGRLAQVTTNLIENAVRYSP